MLRKALNGESRAMQGIEWREKTLCKALSGE